jgi:hypothetical protein
MSVVGVVSIALGFLIVCARGPLVVAPAAWLRWFRVLVETNKTTRVFAAFLLIVSAAMVWAGTTDETALAVILRLWGVLGLVLAPLMVIFPGPCREFIGAFFPTVGEMRLPGWRLIGVLNVIVGSLLVCFGALAL